MTQLLFLDFDGVLHPTSARREEHFCRNERLSQALAGTECRIVISSSWRHHEEPSHLVARFPADLRERIVGATDEPWVGRWPRYHEIATYLRTAPYTTSWRALDDAWFEFPPACSELIRCDPNIGIDTEQVLALRAWLQAS